MRTPRMPTCRFCHEPADDCGAACPGAVEHARQQEARVWAPTPAEIAREAAKIQSEWSDAERNRRAMSAGPAAGRRDTARINCEVVVSGEL